MTLSEGNSVTLDSVASSHLVKVLRNGPGDPVVLFNGDGNNYACTIEEAHPKHTRVVVNKAEANVNESPVHTTLVQGLSRHDRMETSVQKCVELGINRIIPVMFQRSNVRLAADKREKKREHWQRVARSACEQSGRSIVPDIERLITPDELPGILTDESFAQAIKLVLDPLSDRGIANTSISGMSAPAVCYVIGPEGGLDDNEFAMLDALSFQRVRFGNRVLRTETAGPSVLAAIQLLWGDC